ncbi:MAG: hypothetical protein ACI8W8_001101, partial [Rhodothermales bacterium]
MRSSQSPKPLVAAHIQCLIAHRTGLARPWIRTRQAELLRSGDRNGPFSVVAQQRVEDLDQAQREDEEIPVERRHDTTFQRLGSYLADPDPLIGTQAWYRVRGTFVDERVEESDPMPVRAYPSLQVSAEWHEPEELRLSWTHWPDAENAPDLILGSGDERCLGIFNMAAGEGRVRLPWRPESPLYLGLADYHFLGTWRSPHEEFQLREPPPPPRWRLMGVDTAWRAGIADIPVPPDVDAVVVASDPTRVQGHQRLSAITVTPPRLHEYLRMPGDPLEIHPGLSRRLAVSLGSFESQVVIPPLLYDLRSDGRADRV